MSHFSQTALPHEYSNKQTKKSSPSECSVDLANAFIQICKYHQGRYQQLIYDDSSSLYYTLFVDNEGDTLKNITRFIHDNMSLLIQYLDKHYCEEYKSTSYYKEKKMKWEQCSVDNIIYALSANHDQCLQQLDYNGDGFIWITHICDYSGDEPCNPHETSVSKTIQKKLKVHTKKKQGEWTYYTDGVIGGADY